MKKNIIQIQTCIKFKRFTERIINEIIQGEEQKNAIIETKKQGSKYSKDDAEFKIFILMCIHGERRIEDDSQSINPAS